MAIPHLTLNQLVIGSSPIRPTTFLPWRFAADSGALSMMADVRPGTGSSYPHLFTALGEQIFFVGDDQSGRPTMVSTHEITVPAIG
jgi:hypothetical protein